MKGERAGLGEKGLQLQCSSKKVSARPMGNPRQGLPIGGMLPEAEMGGTQTLRWIKSRSKAVTATGGLSTNDTSQSKFS